MEANQLTAEELAAIRERESKATPGPWVKDADPNDVVIWSPGEEFVCNVGHRFKPASVAFDADAIDADFIAAARTDIPRLLATVEALRAALSEIEKGRGPRAADPLTHADNIIANLQRIAREALAGTWRPTDAD